MDAVTFAACSNLIFAIKLLRRVVSCKQSGDNTIDIERQLPITISGRRVQEPDCWLYNFLSNNQHLHKEIEEEGECIRSTCKI